MNRLHKTVFFDRDGVLNKERTDYVKSVDELEIFPNVAENVKILKKSGFKIVVITNQSAINRDLMTHEDLNKIHFTIQNHFQKNGTKIDAFYYCPHRPDENCECRKPKPGLFFKASKELNLDLKNSWMIGNNESDMQAAQLAGCKSIKINNYSKIDSAVDQILKFNV
jgi:histidinol-phosphate phosphatase family protein